LLTDLFYIVVHSAECYASVISMVFDVLYSFAVGHLWHNLLSLLSSVMDVLWLNGVR